MNQPDPSGSTVTPVLVEDLFVTEVFLIKGRVAGKTKRLSNLLQDYERQFLEVSDATMVSLRTGEVVKTPRVMINTSEIRFAHELVEVAGDFAMRQLGKNEKPTRIRAFYSGATQFELAGQIEPGAYELNPLTQRRYFIMQQPTIRGLDLQHPELDLLRNLEYAIVRHDGMSYVYDFS